MNASGIGQRIREIRHRLRLTQQELAKQLGLKTGSAISAYETGDALPTVDTLITLAEIGKTSYEWILHGGHMAGTPDGKTIQLTSDELKLFQDLRRVSPEIRDLVTRLIEAVTAESNSKNRAN
jgi:transcriptional regulator with XRE-family HTH domain